MFRYTYPHLLLPLLLSFPFHSSCSDGPSSAERTSADILADACEYLWSKQSDDGGWHSETHGILKSGQAWTPFILHALTRVPDSIFTAPEGGIKRGLDFISANVNTDGVIGLNDPDIIEYPNYATSYALRLLVEQGIEADSTLIRRMTDYLLAEQFTEKRGVAPDSLFYGGWGFGEINMDPGEVGHVDLSHTRRILQALRALPLSSDHDSCFARSRPFLHLLQKLPDEKREQPTMDPAGVLCSRYDGGFYSSPIVWFSNKGRLEDSCATFASYATATCDGVLALLAAGYGVKDKPVRDGLDWLLRHPSLEGPEGIPQDDPNRWDRVMFYYHLAVRSELYSQTGWPEGFRRKMWDLLNARQREDGSFANPEGALNKEDDPLLATALAIIALNGMLHQ